MHEFPELLAQKGHEVAFVHFPEGWSRKEIMARHHVPRIPGRCIDDVSLRLYSATSFSGSFLGRLVTAVTFGFKFAGLLEDFRPDVIVSYAIPTMGWQASIVARLRKTPFVLRAIDLSTDIRKTRLRLAILWAEIVTLRNATLVSANNKILAERLVGIAGSHAQVNIHLPPLDTNYFCPRNKHDSKVKLGLNPKVPVILFMGTLFRFSGLDRFLRAFASDTGGSSRVVIAGDGEMCEDLKQLCDSLEISNRVSFLGRVDFSDLPTVLSAADVAVSTLVPSPVSDMALPNKLLQYMACGLPTVSTRLRGAESAIPYSPGLTFVNTPEECYSSSVELLADPNNLDGLGASNRKIAMHFFDYENSVRSFERYLEDAGNA